MAKWKEMGYDSAWAAAGIIGEREENCIKDPRPPRVTIQNVILGHTGEAKRAGYSVGQRKIEKKLGSGTEGKKMTRQQEKEAK